MRKSICLAGLAAVTTLATLAVSAQEKSGASSTLVDRGRYLVTVASCGDCHTYGALGGHPDTSRYLGGSEVGFGGPQGVVYPPNLTPGKGSEIANWTDKQLGDAIRYGRRPDGRMLSPVMPWPNLAKLTDEDTAAIVAYLRSLKPVDYSVPPPTPAGQPAPGPYMTVVKGD